MGTQLPPKERGTAAPTFGPRLLWPRSPISATAELLFILPYQQQGKYKSSATAEMGDRLATIDVGQKWGLLCPFLWGGAGSPSNTMSPGPRPTSIPSGILIHPAVWPQ